MPLMPPLPTSNLGVARPRVPPPRGAPAGNFTGDSAPRPGHWIGPNPLWPPTAASEATVRGVLRRRDFVRAAGAGLAGAALAHAGCRDPDGRRPSSRSGPRNIVLIVVDTLRPDHLGCYGNDVVQTPNIDTLAAESLCFTRVFPEAMPTVPARRSILTGRRVYPFRGWAPWGGLAKRAGWSPIMPGTPTLPTILREGGYWTAYVSDNPFLTHTPVFAPFRDSLDRYVRVMNQRGSLRPADSVPRGEAAGRRPYLMVVDSFDPHEYWAPLRQDLELYADPSYRGADIADVRYTWSDYLSGDELRHLRATYAASVTAVDRWLGHFLAGLRGRGLEQDTVVALVSDHGIYLGEHRLTGKSDSYLHPELIHVPLLLRHPDGRGAGATTDYYATTTDLAPTLTAMAGAPPPRRVAGTPPPPPPPGGGPPRRGPVALPGGGAAASCSGPRRPPPRRGGFQSPSRTVAVSGSDSSIDSSVRSATPRPAATIAWMIALSLAYATRFRSMPSPRR